MDWMKMMLDEIIRVSWYGINEVGECVEDQKWEIDVKSFVITY